MNGIIAGLISMFGWGTSDFLAAKCSRRFGYLMTLFWTQVLGLLIALMYLPIKISEVNLDSIYSNLTLIILVALLNIIAYFSFYGGLQSGMVSLISPIASSWVMITVVLSVMVFGEALKTNQIIAISLIIVGILLTSVDLKDFSSNIKKLGFVAEARNGFITMLGWGFGTFLMTPISKDLGWFFAVISIRMTMMIFLIFYHFLRRQSFKINVRDSYFPLLLLMSLIDVCAYFAYSLGVGKDYTSIVAPIAASSPLVAIILATAFLKEKLVLNQILGIFSIISGLILISL